MLRDAARLFGFPTMLVVLAVLGEHPAPHECASCGGIWSEVHTRAKLSVVTVECLLPEDEGYQEVLSGVAIDRGVIVTVGLRPAGRAPVVCVRDAQGKTHAATWMGLDSATGIAVLTTAPDAVPPIELATAEPRVGQPVLVVGNPYGLRLSAKVGWVAGQNRVIKLRGRLHSGLIQLSVPIHPGDNGAPVCNCRGEMVGIIRSGLSVPGPEGVPVQVEGVAFATSISLVRAAVNRVLSGDRAEQVRTFDETYFGVVPAPTTTADLRGLRVLRVVSGSPADKAGIRSGDVIVRVAGTEVDDPGELARVLASYPPGSRISVELVRGEQRLEVDVILGKRRRQPGSKATPPVISPSRRGTLEQRIRRLESQLEQLRRDLEQLKD